MNLTQREKAFEDLFAHDQELHFKIRSKRNKLAGLWAAEKLGKQPDAAAEYANKLVAAMLNRQQLFDKLKADFKLGGASVSDDEILAKVHDLIIISRKHFMEDKSA